MYTYDRLTDDAAYLGFGGIDVGSIGKSVLGLNIPYIHTGSYDGRQIIVTGGIHARENVSSLLVARQAFRLAFGRESFCGGVYFLPMLNPDGALLIEKGLEGLKDTPLYSPPQKAGLLRCHQEFLLELNGENGKDFSLWKANINGVDLNNNFDALFGLGIGQKTSPAPQGYPGEFPCSQSESRALIDFTLSVRPALTLSYHALGREVYWSFFQNEKDVKRDRIIAETVANHLDYKLVDSDMGSTGGYKDWCIKHLGIPALTVEIIADTHSHPLDNAVLEEDWEQNKDIPALLSRLICDKEGRPKS